MKICPQCKVEKDESCFYKKTKTQLQSYCKDCFNRYCQTRWVSRKKKAIVYLGDKCYDCKETYQPEVYDFHHLDANTKELEWVKMRLHTWDNVVKELDKCVLLCSNCHRIRHTNDRLCSNATIH
jgi:hypothetical protein